ncbi:MAG TPA: acyl-CoA dehydrogenase family protein [Anaerolineales bacterium]|nr:acyl-CoA dehydrogenase family protein [Anaerolineales bacterium]
MDFELNEEQRMWKDMVHNFVAQEVKPLAQMVDEEGQFNWQATKKMGPVGLLGLNVPEEFGGAEVDAISAAIAVEELGWGCGSTALSISAHNGLGCAPLTLFGDDEVKQRFLQPVASGEGQLAALALTEPGAGSDLQGGVLTRAELAGDEWVINGTKMWCTNASIADYIVTLVRTDPRGGSHSLSLIVVPTDAPGLTIGPPEKKMGLKGSPTNPVTYEDVHVPENYLLGAVGQGLQQTLQILDWGRVSIGALSVGLAQAAFEEAVRYANERHTFGVPLTQHQAIQFMLADAATQIQAARLFVYYAAWLKDQGRPFSTEASMAKLNASEMAEKVCRDAIQILGGYGYSRDYPVERIYRDTRLMTIGEGTSEVQRMVIARRIL